MMREFQDESESESDDENQDEEAFYENDNNLKVADIAPRGGGPRRYSGKRVAHPVMSPPMSSLAPDQVPSMSELSTPVTPDSVAVNTLIPFSPVAIETPRNDIVSTISSNKTDGTRIRIEIVLGW